MTRLSEAIRRATRPEAPHIGFAPTLVKTHPSMLLIAQAGDGAAEALGADAVLYVASAAPSAANSNGAAEKPLRGLWLQGNAGAEHLDGIDFLVFDGDESPASVLLEENAGLVLHVQGELTDSLLQAMQWLPLDALLVGWEGTLTVRRQLELQRLSGFSRKPLLLVLQHTPAGPELEALREAGVIGVVVDLAAAGGAERLATLRTTIDGLRPRPKRGREDAAIVSIAPSMAAVPSREPEEPDEDDDD